MSWSTREIAELAGTTVKSVRYYHAIGLLEEPDRSLNGYKHYEVEHLTRLLQIRRLVGLGVPLAQIARLGDQDGDGVAAIFRRVDAELEATVERLQDIRRELAVLSRPGAPTDVPAGFSAVADALRGNDRKLLTIYAQLFSDESMEAVRELLESDPNPELDEAFRDLPEDADEATRAALAERLSRVVSLPGTGQGVELVPKAGSPRQTAAARSTVAHALEALYNPAQLDVLRRARQVAAARAGADGPGAGPDPEPPGQ
ncbi:MerR family transcriptional regulator [Promicromonospora thailandica]|uniref:DNA-binding transcriptional regulator, MerR family n=1 Tax=Promicromonospora thailandica TaxID=765201 RepID=A0A9X2JXY0_9MICO|nr:MerR family transcriptional regulator [Promicromonospora thailandica]MCP2267077.1 DNA-binding transcriptional regulator, MerR family [Promicromonospora thailandica]BFF16642.1 MerR family transcriptional regulator [Promicromonospora thailandica]